MHKVKITDTTLRDAHQSLWATRMHIEDMIPIVKSLDEVGYNALEVWGGATFDVCMRFLGEDPWERLRTLKKHITKTPLQMLLRGQSLVGYQHYPDDVVEAFIVRAVANGIDIIRIFDALNDIRNMEYAITIAKREGAHVQGSVVYTISPVHTLEMYLDMAIKLEKLGVDSICIKDMAGLLTPYKAFEMIKLFKDHLSIPVELHNHYIGGLAVATCIKAAEAGVDVIDTASGPLAFGASQPPVETLVKAFEETPYDTGLKLSKLFEIDKYFEALRVRLGYDRGVTRISDMQVFEHQVPGGMITNLVSQLKEQKAIDKLDEVLAEIPRVRKELGYPPLVTPTSQIVGTQAVLNVISGQRYKLVPGEVKAYFKGLYGLPPAPVDEALKKKIIGDEEPIKGRPADILEPRMASAKEELKDLTDNIDDIVSYALFPQVAKKFLEAREKGQIVRESHLNEVKNAQSSTRESIQNMSGNKDGENMNINEIKILISEVNKSSISELSIKSEGMELKIKKNQEGIIQEKAFVSSSQTEESFVVAPIEESEVLEGTMVKAPMVGTFYMASAPDADPYVKVGQNIKVGDTLCIVEAMKLMNEIESEVNGRVVKVLVEDGSPVEYGQDLFLIEEA